MATINVVTEDKVIVVDGEAINHTFTFPANLWAIQWDGTEGHAEWTNGPNTELTAADVETYVTQWTDAKASDKASEDAAILAESTRVKTYTELRVAAYADLNQFEMQFDDAVNNTTTWVDAINAIKQEFPK